VPADESVLQSDSDVSVPMEFWPHVRKLGAKNVRELDICILRANISSGAHEPIPFLENNHEMVLGESGN